MGFIASTLERRMHDGPMSTLAEPHRSLLEALGLQPSIAGVSVTPAKAEGLPAVYGCIDVIAAIEAWLPLKLMKALPEGGREADLAHPLYAVLHDLPNHLMTAFDFRNVMARWKLLWGTAYAEIERDRQGRITALWPLRTDRMERPQTDALNRLVWTYRLEDGSPKTYVWDPVRPPLLRLLINSLDGITGRSPIRVLMDSLGVSIAARDFGGFLFANKTNPGGILKFKGASLKPEERERNKAEWQKAFGGVHNAGKTAVLSGDVEYQAIGMPPREAQFIELMKFQLEEIAGRIYRVPPFLLGNTEKSTSWGTGLEQQLRGFLTITMMPHLTGWTQAIARDLLTAKSFTTHKAVFVTNALVAADLLQRIQAHKAQIECGMETPNEARATEDQGPRRLPDGSHDPEGDAYWRPVNMASTADPPTPPDDPAPTPADPPTNPDEDEEPDDAD